jgi:cyclase
VLKNRIIPVLLLDNDGLVKTTRFKDPRYVGDPINAIRIFNEKEVDEIIVLDITATRGARKPNYHLIERLAEECFMPLTYGGGITTVEEARVLFSLGIEKISLQTAAFRDTNLITRLSDSFGSQSIIASVDIKNNWHGKTMLYCSSTRKLIAGSWLDFIKNLAKAGAGEVLLNSVDVDGTLEGPNIERIREASSVLSVPLISLGGISSILDIKHAIQAGASAVAAGSFFVFHGQHRAVLITYPKYKELESLFEENE